MEVEQEQVQQAIPELKVQEFTGGNENTSRSYSHSQTFEQKHEYKREIRATGNAKISALNGSIANGSAIVANGSSVQHAIGQSESTKTRGEFSESSSEILDEGERRVHRIKKTKADRDRKTQNGAEDRNGQESRHVYTSSHSESRSTRIRVFDQRIGVINEQLDHMLQRIEDEIEGASTLSTKHEKMIDDMLFELERMEEPIEDLIVEVDRLRHSRHPSAAEYNMQVTGLQQRRHAYLDRLAGPHKRLTGGAMNGTMSSYRWEEMQEERYFQKVTQVFETSGEYIRWVDRMMEELSDMQFVSDVTALEELFERHQIDHRDIVDFRQNVDQAIARQAEVSNEDSPQYCEVLAELERKYEELRELSCGRMVDLDSLLAFVRNALTQLEWIQEHQEPEVTRDWSDVNRLDLPILEHYYKQLLHEIELREVHFNGVFNQGTALIKQQHPATNVIESYLGVLQTQWDWLLALTKCFEIHLQDAVSLREILEESVRIDTWFDRQMELLATKFTRDSCTLEEGEALLQDLADMREAIDRYFATVLTLMERSRTVSPLWKRAEPITTPILMTALCDYDDQEISIRKGEECLVLDNSDAVYWSVRATGGVQARVPSVVFRVPPPDPRLISILERLQAKMDQLRKLWLEKHQRIRYNMILDSIFAIKAWDLEKFMSMDPDQREAILNALNSDGNRLLDELDPNDPLARRLKEELRLANEHYYWLLQQSLKTNETDYGDLFNEKASDLLKKLEEAMKLLNQRMGDPIPTDLEALEKLISQHHSFEEALQELEPDISALRELFHQIPDPTPSQRALMQKIDTIWQNLWELSRAYVQRLKALEALLSSLDEAKHILRESELILGNFDPLPSDLERLRAIHSRLLELQLVLQQNQAVFEHLSTVSAQVRQHVARCRPNVASHPDVDRAEDDVQAVIVRWENLGSQVIERLKTVEIACQTIMTYRPSYDNEWAWLDRVENTIKNLRSPEQLRPEEYEIEMDKLMSEYNSLKERAAAVEKVNQDGGRYIREAKMYDSRVSSYYTSLKRTYSNLDSLVSGPDSSAVAGSTIVTRELEELNRRFAQLPSFLMERYRLLQTMLEKWRSDNEAEAARRRAEEEARRRAEAEARRLAEEEAERLRLQRLADEERAREEAERERQRAREEAERLRRAQEEAERERQRQREEAERQRRAEEEADRERQRQREDAERRRRAEEEAERERQRRAAEDAERERRRIEAEKRGAEEAERERQRQAAEDAERERKRRAEAEKRAQEEADRERQRRIDMELKYAQEQEERQRAEEAERLRRERDAADRAREEYQRKVELEHVRARPPSPPRQVRPPSPKLNVRQGQSSVDWHTGEVAGGFDEMARPHEIATMGEQEDEMQVYEEWTETKTQFYELEAIRHLQTGEILTFVEALRQGLLDLHSGNGEFFDLISGSKISLQEAVDRGYISESFQECLNKNYGIRDPGTLEELTLLQAIQRRIYDPESRQLKDPVGGDLMSLEEAVMRKVITFQEVHKLVKMGILKLPPVQIEHAIEQGMINVETGMFRGRVTREELPLKDALRNEYISLSSPLPAMIGISLTEAAELGFINLHSAEFTDRWSGDKVTLKDATSRLNPILNLNVREAVNTEERKRISLGEAVVRNIINTRNNQFSDKKSNRDLSLIDAFNEDLIQRPLTLKEICRKDLIDSTGRFIDPGTKKRLNLLEAVAEGLIDADAEHIVDAEDNEIISIAEALERGLLSPLGYFTPDSSTQLTISHAMSRHILADRVRHSIFDVKGVKNTKNWQMVSFNEALELGIIQRHSERFIDLASNESYLLQDATERGLLDTLLHGVLTASSGIQDKSGTELTVMQAVCRNFIDPKKGVIIEQIRKLELSPREAYEHHRMLSLKGAIYLEGLLNVPPHYVAVPKPVKLAQRKRKRKTDTSGASKDQVKITLEEALKKGIIDARTQRFKQGEQEMSLQDALNQGIVDAKSEWIMPQRQSPQAGPSVQETTTEQITETSEVVAPKPGRTAEETFKTVHKERRTETTASGAPGSVSSYRALMGGTQLSFEVPQQGFGVMEAEKQDILNMNTGMVSLPNTGHSLSLGEAFNLGILNAAAITFRDPNSGKVMRIGEAMEKGLVDETGHVFDGKSGRKLSFQAAIDADIISVSSTSVNPSAPKKTIKFGIPEHISAMPSGTATYEESHSAWEFDAKTGSVEDMVTGETLTLDDAVRKSRIPLQHVMVRDSLTGREMTFPEAVRWGSIDQRTNQYIEQQSGRTYFLREASQRGWVRVAGPAADSKDTVKTAMRQQTRKVTAQKDTPHGGPAVYTDTKLEDLLVSANFNDSDGTFVHTNTGKSYTLKEAIIKGYFNPYEVQVTDPVVRKPMFLLDAIEAGLIDPFAGTYVDSRSNRTMSLRDAVSQGLIKSGLPENLKQQLSQRQRESPRSSGRSDLSVNASVAGSGQSGPGGPSLGLIHVSPMRPQASPSSRAEMIDVGGGKQALVKVIKGSDGIERGEYVDDATGMKFTVQLHGDPYHTKSKTTVKSSSQMTAVELEPYAEFVGIDKVRDNRSGRVWSLVEAQRMGLAKIDQKSKEKVKSYAVFRSDISYAVSEGILDPMHRGERMSLQDAIQRGIIDIRRLEFRNPASQEILTLSQAANAGLIDVTLSEVLPKGVVNPVNGERVSIAQAMQHDIVLPNGDVQNPHTRQSLSWLDILKPVYASITQEGIYDPRKGYAVPVISALNDNLVDLTSETYRNPITGECLSLNEARQKGLIDEDTLNIMTRPSIKDWVSRSEVSLLQAIRQGLVDLVNRTVRLSPDHVERIGRAVEMGQFPKDVGNKLRQVDRWTFVDALGRGLVDVKNNQFTDPDTGHVMSLPEALEKGFLDSGDKDSAMETNLAYVVNRSIDFDHGSGRIRDPKGGLNLSFHQGVENKLIDEDSLIYETNSGKTWILREAMNRSIIDEGGKYADGNTGNKMTLRDAVAGGFLALIASPMQASQAVAEAVKRREAEGFRFRIEGVQTSPGGGGGKSSGSPRRVTTEVIKISGSGIPATATTGVYVGEHQNFATANYGSASSAGDRYSGSSVTPGGRGETEEGYQRAYVTEERRYVGPDGSFSERRSGPVSGDRYSSSYAADGGRSGTEEGLQRAYTSEERRYVGPDATFSERRSGPVSGDGLQRIHVEQRRVVDPPDSTTDGNYQQFYERYSSRAGSYPSPKRDSPWL